LISTRTVNHDNSCLDEPAFKSVGTQYCSDDCNGKKTIATQTLKPRPRGKRNDSDRNILAYVQSAVTSKTIENNKNPLFHHDYCISTGPSPLNPSCSKVEETTHNKVSMDIMDDINNEIKSDNDEEQYNVMSSSENEDSESSHDEYQYNSSDDEESTDESDDEVNSNDSTHPSRTFIVFESQLDELFKFCHNCKSLVCEVRKTTRGSMVTIQTLCINHHEFTWKSQPTTTHKNIPSGNLLIPAAIICTGGTFQEFSNFAEALQLQFIGKSSFFKMQSDFILPVINKQYKDQQNKVIAEIKGEMPVDLCGDGRSDSPGHTAKYGTYSLMSEKSGKIVDFSLVHVSEVSSSNAMEYEGCKRSLNNLLQREVSIRCLTTDRHTQITAQLAKQYPTIIHQYDVWHLAKWVMKKLSKKAKTKANSDLQPWIRSISNHLWWSAKECNGDPDVLVNNWTSIVNHVADKHTWKEGKINTIHSSSKQFL